MSSFVLSSNAGIPFFKILCLSTYIIAYGTEITTETICHLSVAYLLIDCLLLVAIISPKKLFVNPVFPTLPWKIPAVFPVKVTFKTSTKKTAKTQTKKLNYTFTVAKASVALSGDSAVAVGNTTKLTIGKDTATATHEVEVKNYVLSTVGQSKLTELTATVTGDTKNLKASDFTVKNETTNVVYPVSKVSVDSKDATKVTLTLFSELNDAANYDVTLDGTTKSFKASDGKVASIALDQATIPYATETEVKLVSKDVNGVVLKELTTTDAASDANYNFTIDTKGNGYTNGSKLYLNKVNDTAEATIEYKTGKYDQNSKAEGNIGPNKVTVTAVDQVAVSGFAVRIDDSGKSSFDKATNI